MINITPRVRRAPIAAAAGVATAMCLALTACTGTNSGKSTKPALVRPAVSSPAPSRPTSATAAISPAGAGSACALVTLHEVTTATGEPMAVSGNAGGICSFSATADPSLLVYVQLYPDTPSMRTPKQIEAGSQHLPGLGDNAFFATAGIVFVQKGSRGFTITMPSLTVAGLNAPPAIVALANDALNRL